MSAGGAANGSTILTIQNLGNFLKTLCSGIHLKSRTFDRYLSKGSGKKVLF